MMLESSTPNRIYLYNFLMSKQRCSWRRIPHSRTFVVAREADDRNAIKTTSRTTDQQKSRHACENSPTVNIRSCATFDS